VVHLWHEWDILAIFELGRVYEKLEKDEFDGVEPGNYRDGGGNLRDWIVC
jgi:hypothetical protein